MRFTAPFLCSNGSRSIWERQWKVFLSWLLPSSFCLSSSATTRTHDKINFFLKMSRNEFLLVWKCRDFSLPILGMNPIHLARILDELLEGFTRKQMDWDKVIYLLPIRFCILIFDLFLGDQLQVFGTSFGFYSLFLELWIQLWQDSPVRESMSFQKK